MPYGDDLVVLFLNFISTSASILRSYTPIRDSELVMGVDRIVLYFVPVFYLILAAQSVTI